MKDYKTPICRSSAQCIADRVKRTLLNLDTEIARVVAEISLRNEKIDFYSMSSKKSDQKKFIQSKIEKENFEVYQKRLEAIKKDLCQQLRLVANKYEGNYSKIFYDYFFQDISVEDICEKYTYNKDFVVSQIIKMSKDIIDIFGYKKKSDI